MAASDTVDMLGMDYRRLMVFLVSPAILSPETPPQAWDQQRQHQHLFDHLRLLLARECERRFSRHKLRSGISTLSLRKGDMAYERSRGDECV
jgi:hypothetical protein